MEFPESEKILGVPRPAVALLQGHLKMNYSRVFAVTKRRQAIALQGFRSQFLGPRTCGGALGVWLVSVCVGAACPLPNCAFNSVL